MKYASKTKQQLLGIIREANNRILVLEKAELERQQLFHAHGERVKELSCLYGIANLVETPGSTVDSIIQGAVEIIPESWQYPEITCSRIIVNDKPYESWNFEETIWHQKSIIHGKSKPIGSVEVFYLEEMPQLDEGPFLKEERLLIDGIAERIGKVLRRKKAEKKLQISEYNLSQSQRIAHLGSWEWDIRSDIVIWSRELYRIFGLQPHTKPASRDALLEFVHEDDKDLVISIADEFLSGTKTDETFDHGIVMEDGTKRYVQSRCWMQEDEHEKPIKLYGTMFDITNLKNAADALRQSQKKYKNLINSIPDISWIINNNGDTIFISNNVIEIFGYSPVEVYQKGRSLFSERTHPYDIDRVKESYREFFKSGKSLDLEYRIQRKDGNWIWAHERSINSYTQNGVEFASGLLGDVTRRKRAEGALQESELELSSIYENSPVPMFLLSSERQVAKLNGEALKLTNLPRNESIGLKIGKVLNCVNVEKHPKGCGFSSKCVSCGVTNCVSENFRTRKSVYRSLSTFISDQPNGPVKKDIRISTTRLPIPGRDLLHLCIEDVTDNK